MKASRRHELKENELDHVVTDLYRYLQKHGRSVATIGVAVVVVIGVGWFAVDAKTRALEDSWSARAGLKFTGTDVTADRPALTSLIELRKKSSDEAFVSATLLEEASFGLRLASKVDNPPDAELNKIAEEALTELLNRSKGKPILEGIARSGLASVAENHFALTGDLSHKETARKHLIAIRDNPAFNDTPFKSDKSQASVFSRLDQLDLVFRPLELGPPSAPPTPTAAAGLPISVQPIKLGDQVITPNITVTHEPAPATAPATPPVNESAKKPNPPDVEAQSEPDPE